MIAIVDYGMGNLRSVEKAFAHVGAHACVTDNPNRIAEADRVVLPGVGAFKDAIDHLQKLKLVEPIKEVLHKDRPFLGICLGLQLLFERSYEDGEFEGLGVIEGEVVRFPLDMGLKVPHMGWNRVEFQQTPPVLAQVPAGSHFYFVHSYYVAPRDPRVVAGKSSYGQPFTAMVARGRMLACQFHPEKSQRVGLQILKNFTTL